MRRLWLAGVIVAALAGGAHAGPFETMYAQLLGLDEAAVVETRVFELPRDSAYSYVLAGSYRSGERVVPRSLLVRCGRRTCTSTSVPLFAAGEVELLGIVDLLAAPQTFPARRIAPRYRGQRVALGAARMKRPVLIVRSATAVPMTTTDRGGQQVTGTQRHARIAFVSLARADARAPTIFDAEVEARGPTGAGFVVTLAFARGAGKTLDIVATEQRLIDRSLACLPPPPTKTRYTLGEDRRYHADAGLSGRAGC